MCSTAPSASDSPGANARTVAFASRGLAHDVLHRAVCLRRTRGRTRAPSRLPPDASRVVRRIVRRQPGSFRAPARHLRRCLRECPPRCRAPPRGQPRSLAEVAVTVGPGGRRHTRAMPATTRQAAPGTRRRSRPSSRGGRWQTSRSRPSSRGRRRQIRWSAPSSGGSGRRSAASPQLGARQSTRLASACPTTAAHRVPCKSPPSAQVGGRAEHPCARRATPAHPARAHRAAPREWRRHVWRARPPTGAVTWDSRSASRPSPSREEQRLLVIRPAPTR